jgi:hypothetical protein
MTSADLIPAAVLKRKAVVDVRQSTQSQVMTNLEGQAPIRSGRGRPPVGFCRCGGDRRRSRTIGKRNGRSPRI